MPFRPARSITLKYSAVIFVLCLVCVVLTAGIAHYKSSHELEIVAENELVSLRDSRISALSAYLNSVRQDLRIITGSPTTGNALRDLTQAWKGFDGPALNAVQSLYTAAVPFFDKRDADGDEDDLVSRYNRAHDQYHYWFWKLLFERGYYDLFLIDTSGNVVYSALKESDFGTNLREEPFDSYGLAQAFAKAIADHKREIFVDFAPYPPSGGGPAGFVATSVFDDQGTLLGVLALQMPIDRINAAMQISPGVGAVGEMILVGPDLRARGGSRLTDDSDILGVEVDMPTVRAALAGASGIAVVGDYRGRQVYSAYATIHLLGTTWAVLANIDRDEVLAPVENTTRFIVWTSSVIFLVVLPVGIFFGSRLSRPISAIAHAMRDLADGNLAVSTPYATRRDEVGDLASALETFKQAKQDAAAATAELEAFSRRLLEREERLSLVLRGGDLGYWDVDLDTGRTQVNARYDEIFGFAPNRREVARNDWVEAIHPEDRDYALTLGKRYREGENADYEVEYRVVRPDGEIRWVVSKGAVVEWRDDDTARRMVGTVQDVTARKIAEQALKESRERLERILMGSPIGVVIVDLDEGRAVFANPHASKLLGVPVERILEMRHGDFYQRDEQRIALLEQLERDGKVEGLETTIVRADGKTVWLMRSIYPFEYEGHRAIISWNYDITPLKDAEAILQKKERNLRDVLESSPIGVAITAEDPFRVPFANSRFTELFGVDPDSDVPLERYIHETYVDSADFSRLREAVRSDAPSVTLEIQRRRLDGPPWWSLFTRTFAEYNDEPVSINWYVDITEMKEAEAKLRQQTEELDLALLSLEIKEAQLQKIIDDSPVGIAVVRASDGVVVDTNPSFCNLVGQPVETVQNGPVAQFYHPDDADRRRRILQMIDTEDEVRDQEIRLVDAAGNATWVLLSVTQIDTSRGEPARLSWYYNIDAQKRAEDRLRDSERRMRAVLETSPVGVGIAVGGRPVFYNARMLEMLGRDQATYVGHDATDLYVDPSQREEIVAEVARAGEVRDREVAFHKTDGEVIDTLSSYFPIQHEGQDAILIWLYDITRRKQAERALVDALSVIRESVTYASNIQGSLLPTAQQLATCTSEHFMIWEPRDIVGGDMIWLRECRGGTVIAVCDCTGHGVPGAFMTLIGTGSINQALIDHPAGEPERLLESMNRHVKQSLKQDGEQGLADDGMELGICRIDSASGDLTFAGARFSLFRLQDGTVFETKGDRSGIGYRHVPADRRFASHAVPDAAAAAFYMVSDGMIDQIGGERRRAFGRKRLLGIIEETAALSFAEQRETILCRFAAHQGREIRRDDVTMLGFRLPSVVGA